MIVFHTAGRRDFNALRLNECRESAGDAEASTGEFLLGEKDAVNEGVRVVCKECLRQKTAVDGAFVKSAESGFEFVEERLVLLSRR